MSGKKKSGAKPVTIEQLQQALEQSDKYDSGRSWRSKIRATEHKLEEQRRLIHRTLKLIKASRL